MLFFINSIVFQDRMSSAKQQEDPIERRVKKANQQFYDIVSDSYEAVDGKRDRITTTWIAKKLRQLQKQTNGKTLLDIGCGSGFILRNAQPYYKTVIGVDISLEILKTLQKQGFLAVCADTDHLPFKDNAFDTITCFAVLHHLYTYEKLFWETHRVLKNNGLFYSDHDLDRTFARKFALPMKIYRSFFNEEKKYKHANKKITSELYHFTEVHHKGINTQHIQEILQKSAFSSVTITYHWLGLFSVLTKILLALGSCCFKQGNAPLVSFIARK